MDSSVDEALFMTQNSTNTDISAEIEGNGLEHLVISASGLKFNLPKSGISIFFVK